jgi:phosphoglucosamine mutase
VLVRYSGTESLCRVMVEGPTAEVTDKWAEEIAQVVRLALG